MVTELQPTVASAAVAVSRRPTAVSQRTTIPLHQTQVLRRTVTLKAWAAWVDRLHQPIRRSLKVWAAWAPTRHRLMLPRRLTVREWGLGLVEPALTALGLLATPTVLVVSETRTVQLHPLMVLEA
jgi:hypothetical protein